MLAAIRPDSINLALFVHVAGAMILVGGLVTAAVAGLAGWRDPTDRLRRFSYWVLLAVALPGWIVMRAGGEWVYAKEQLDQIPTKPAWIGIGMGTSDGGGVLLLIALILGGIGLRRGGDRLLKASAAISLVLVIAYLIAVWAMGGKPA
jgi:hypothetical protein